MQHRYIVGVGVGLRMETQPGTSIAGSAFGTQPVVAIVDGGGSVVTTDFSTVCTVTLVQKQSDGTFQPGVGLTTFDSCGFSVWCVV